MRHHFLYVQITFENYSVDYLQIFQCFVLLSNQKMWITSKKEKVSHYYVVHTNKQNKVKSSEGLIFHSESGTQSRAK